jgi:short-subunit dehydrogenase
MKRLLVTAGILVAAIGTTTFVAAVGATAYACTRRRDRARLKRGQVAIITGGSTGLGLALAHRLGRAGLKLVLAARSKEQLEEAKRELLASGSIVSEEDVLIVSCDLTDQQQAKGLIDTVLQAFGTFHVLINNAGVIEVGPMEDQPLKAYERAMAINFFGAVYTTYAALPTLLGNKAGAIVNISSIGGKLAVPHLMPYVASKFALTGFSEGLHAELHRKGVRVTTVCPGLMRTGGERHAHFYGSIDKEKKWFQTAARTPLLTASARNAANQIFKAVASGKTELTITPQAWLAARFVGVAPGMTQALSAFFNEYLLPASVNRAKSLS